ncbi:ferredoxin--NADP reductase [Gangjinia marincola]|uniref:Ferredoxin--NADP reductase n=1 Tax=Gangjinia marincola TaxID=578463 RepID=A0ABN1MHW4_9FLAO
MGAFHTLRIKHIERVTVKSVAITFTVPQELEEEFTFLAGQYVTLKTTIDGEEVRRAYSICSSPSSGKLTVSVKEVDQGTFSRYANQQLKEGDTLEVHAPEGKFTFTPNPENDNAYAAFAAGSGITPILSIIKTVLTQERKSKFALVYGNKSPELTMFYEDLLELQQEYKDRFFVDYVFSQTNEENCLFGRIEKSTVNYMLKNKFSAFDFTSYYLCGPKPMIDMVSEVLSDQGVGDSRIHFELFTTNDVEGKVETDLDGQTSIKIIVDDEESSFHMPKTSTILEAALDKELDTPYSCQGGICSSCIARIKEGSAEMKKNQILTDSEVAEGLILTCQAHPTSDTVVVDYDDV